MHRKKHYYESFLVPLARKLRNNASLPEIALWMHLKGKKMRGYDFHRQKPILNYICDFYCFKLDLCIEVDGKQHLQEEQRIKDAQKDHALQSIGIQVLRFPATAVLYNMNLVLAEIENYIIEREKTTHP